MSHKKLRTERNCLNCGETVTDRYCTHCGQENLEIQDSAFHFIIHYIQDLFHYDGKFWHTLQMLFRKPGQVALEYMEGKRARNLEPLRLYVFASTIFFLVLFYFVSGETVQIGSSSETNYKKRLYSLLQEKEFLKGTPDTLYADFLVRNVKEKLDSLERSGGDTIQDVNFNISSPIELDSVEGGWFAKLLSERVEKRRKELEERHVGDESGAFADFAGEVMHMLPQVLFVSMPFFAFFLKLLYFRSSRKRYVEHFIFSVYQYAFFFVTLTFYVFLINLPDIFDEGLLGTIISFLLFVLFIYLFAYLLLAMKRFYHDRWRFLVFRYILLIGMSFISFLMLSVVIMIGMYLW